MAFFASFFTNPLILLGSVFGGQVTIYYDLSFNGAQYLQSLDRIHRVGGSEDNEANYYFLQYNDTIDPLILENLNQKAKKMYNIIDGDYTIYSLDMFESENDGDLEAYNSLFGEL